MDTFINVLEIVLKLIIGLGILNVWLLRRDKNSPWRGGQASNMQEEFNNYGLPVYAMYVVGFLKCAFALVLLISIFWKDAPVDIASYGIILLMAGAILMHSRIGDAPKKSLPAFILMALSVGVVLL